MGGTIQVFITMHVQAKMGEVLWGWWEAMWWRTAAVENRVAGDKPPCCACLNVDRGEPVMECTLPPDFDDTHYQNMAVNSALKRNM